MFRYKVLEEWAAGAFGATCLVEESGGGRRFAVKKVECGDEREGTVSMEEAKLLLRLHHPNICAYKELFMDWDSKISSLFVCLVMDYYDLGNLAGIVQANRQQETIINEKIIQSFLGQTTSALVYVHRQNIIHRNLKPSNILVKSADLFVISDFLPETLATDDVKINIRMDPECKIFMAPESLHFTYSQKSDVWSLGCILLDLMTTSVNTDAEMVTELHIIQVDPSHLHRILQTIQDKVGYSEDLCQLLPKILKIPPAERPTATDLVQDPYVKKCLAMIGSPLSGMKKTLPPDALEELKDGGVEEALEFMKIYMDYEDAQLSALRHLTGYIGDGYYAAGSPHTGEIIRLVSQAMVTHRDSFIIQWEGSHMLHRLLSQVLERGDIEDCPTSEDLVINLVGAVRDFPDNAELMSVVLSIMMLLSVSEAAAEMLGRAGVLPDLVTLLEGSLENRQMCGSCCELVWSLSMIKNQTEGDSLQRAVPVIAALIQKHGSDGQLVESACTALWTLGMKGHVTEGQVEHITLLLLESLQTHWERPLLSKNVCLALTSLVLNSELAVYRMLVPVSGKNAVSLIKELYEVHSDDPDIVQNICLLLSETAHYGSVRPELLSQQVDQLMHEIKEQYDSLEEIITLADLTLSRLEQ